jgi:hypothetical protein
MKRIEGNSFHLITLSTGPGDFKRVAQVSGHHRVQPSGIVDYIIQDENAAMLI